MPPEGWRPGPPGKPGYLFKLLSGTDDVQAVKTAAAFQEELELSTERQVKYMMPGNGRTVLMQMVMHHDWPELARAGSNWRPERELIQRGVYVNAKDTHGNTALHFAALTPSGHRHRGAVRELLEHGADHRIKNNNGKTAADFARSTGRDSVPDEELAVFIESAPTPSGFATGYSKSSSLCAVL